MIAIGSPCRQRPEALPSTPARGFAVLFSRTPRMDPTRSGAAVQHGKRPQFYYDQSRPEVVALVPADCRRVLEVGCAGGRLGRLLKQRGHHVTGIELVSEVAESA